jgi:hypothetical protein
MTNQVNVFICEATEKGKDLGWILDMIDMMSICQSQKLVKVIDRHTTVTCSVMEHLERSIKLGMLKLS